MPRHFTKSERRNTTKAERQAIVYSRRVNSGYNSVSYNSGHSFYSAGAGAYHAPSIPKEEKIASALVTSAQVNSANEIETKQLNTIPWDDLNNPAGISLPNYDTKNLYHAFDLLKREYLDAKRVHTDDALKDYFNFLIISLYNFKTQEKNPLTITALPDSYKKIYEDIKKKADFLAKRCAHIFNLAFTNHVPDAKDQFQLKTKFIESLLKQDNLLGVILCKGVSCLGASVYYSPDGEATEISNRVSQLAVDLGLRECINNPNAHRRVRPGRS